MSQDTPTLCSHNRRHGPLPVTCQCSQCQGQFHIKHRGYILVLGQSKSNLLATSPEIIPLIAKVNEAFCSKACATHYFTALSPQILVNAKSKTLPCAVC